MNKKAASDLRFLVWLDREFYLVEVWPRRKGAFDVSGTKSLSDARHFAEYEEAAHWCEMLRRRYPRTVVTDQRGQPVTPEQLKNLPPVKAYDLPRNARELDSIPADTLRRRIREDPVFRERVFGIWDGTVA
jgi:hypothetical protein